MTSQHHVSELDAINGTKSRPESGPSRDQVISKSLTQLATQSPIQLHKISLPNYCIRFVTDQVGEQVTEHVSKQVPATNCRGHRDLAAEVKSTAKVTARVTAKVTTYPGASTT
ncbi:MAG: hypothetical protein PWR29_1879 [Methanolobus sp.]|nr:hypothetical protein [Methanolobus sp.]